MEKVFDEFITPNKNNNQINFLTDPLTLTPSLLFQDQSFLCECSWKTNKITTCCQDQEIYLFYGCQDFSIKVYNFSTGKDETSLKAHKGEIQILAIHDPNWLYSGCSQGIFCIWNVKDFSNILKLQTNDRIEASLIFKDLYNEINNDYVIVLAFRNTKESVRLYNMKGENIREIKNPIWKDVLAIWEF